MITLSPQSRIFIAIQPVDFRLGIDGLAQCCRSVLAENPMSGAWFVFRNRASTAIKALAYDGQGFWLCHRRLSKGRLNWWPNSPMASLPLPAAELQVLLWNGNPQGAKFAEPWRPLDQAACW